MVNNSKKRRNVDSLVEKEVADLLLKNPDFTGEELKRKVEKNLKSFHYNFTERTYQNIKSKLLPNINKYKELDRPWSIGATIKEVSNDALPSIIEIQTLAKMLFRNQISVRQARWFGYFYPLIGSLTENINMNIPGLFIQLAIYQNVKLDESTAKALIESYKLFENADQEKKQKFIQLAWLAIIGVQYAKLEQINELIEGSLLDTSELDELYFINGNLSAEAIVDSFWKVYATPEQKRSREQVIANFKSLTGEQLQSQFGELTLEEINYANDLLHAFNFGYASGRDWINSHPKEWDVLNKKMESKRNELHQS
jgi:hypothetical protein